MLLRGTHARTLTHTLLRGKAHIALNQPKIRSDHAYARALSLYLAHSGATAVAKHPCVVAVGQAARRVVVTEEGGIRLESLGGYFRPVNARFVQRWPGGGGGGAAAGGEFYGEGGGGGGGGVQEEGPLAPQEVSGRSKDSPPPPLYPQSFSLCARTPSFIQK